MALTIPAFQVQSINLSVPQGTPVEAVIAAKDLTGANVDLTASSGDGPWTTTMRFMPAQPDATSLVGPLTMTNHNGSASVCLANPFPVGSFSIEVIAAGSDGYSHLLAVGTLRSTYVS